jgi:hypothetical protein
MSATDTFRTADRQLIAVQALFAARRYHPRVRGRKTGRPSPGAIPLSKTRIRR